MGITGQHWWNRITAELVFLETVQVTQLPESISQAENAGSIPVTRSLSFVASLSRV